jgi:hypothetical protein
MTGGRRRYSDRLLGTSDELALSAAIEELVLFCGLPPRATNGTPSGSEP